MVLSQQRERQCKSSSASPLEGTKPFRTTFIQTFSRRLSPSRLRSSTSRRSTLRSRILPMCVPFSPAGRVPQPEGLGEVQRKRLLRRFRWRAPSTGCRADFIPDRNARWECSGWNPIAAHADDAGPVRIARRGKKPLGAYGGIEPAGLPANLFLILGRTYNPFSAEQLEERYPNRKHKVLINGASRPAFRPGVHD